MLDYLTNVGVMMNSGPEPGLVAALRTITRGAMISKFRREGDNVVDTRF